MKKIIAAILVVTLISCASYTKIPVNSNLEAKKTYRLVLNNGGSKIFKMKRALPGNAPITIAQDGTTLSFPRKDLFSLEKSQSSGGGVGIGVAVGVLAILGVILVVSASNNAAAYYSAGGSASY